MSALYLGGLLFSLAGMIILDWRYKLFFFAHAIRAAIVLAVTVVFFVVWDVVGISAGIFFTGSRQWLTGVFLAPDFPLEEVFFLILLGYVTMNTFNGLGRIHEWMLTRTRPDGHP